jgi:hypothetical protein
MGETLDKVKHLVLRNTPTMTEQLTTKLVREGPYIAEVDVTLIDTGHEWRLT